MATATAVVTSTLTVGGPRKKAAADLVPESERFLRACADVANALIEDHEATKDGRPPRDIKLNALRGKMSKKHKLKNIPPLTAIIAAIPEHYKKYILPKLIAKPIHGHNLGSVQLAPLTHLNKVTPLVSQAASHESHQRFLFFSSLTSVTDKMTVTAHDSSLDTSLRSVTFNNGAAGGISEKLIKPWKLPPQKTYVLHNARVVDPVMGTVSPRVVTIADGLITAIGVSVKLQSEEILIDLQGRYLCPGLIDCHVHITSVAGEATLGGAGMGGDPAVSYLRQPFLCRQMLDRGFTTVRDVGGATLALKEAIEDGVFAGPRLFIANKALSQTGGHGDVRGSHEKSQSCCGGQSGMLGVVVDGVDECTRAAREQIRTGADFIKIMASGGVASPTDRLTSTQFRAAEIEAIADVANGSGTYVTAHAYTPQAVRHAVVNGVRGIEHGNLIDEETAELMVRFGVYLTPTLVTYDAMASNKYAGFLPPTNQAKNRAVLERGLESLRIASNAGVIICHGSDLLGPLQAEQSREFAIRASVLSSTKVLQGATVNAASLLRQQNTLGQIREGFKADLLVLDENPLDNAAILSHPEDNVLAVIKDGRVYKSGYRPGKLRNLMPSYVAGPTGPMCTEAGATGADDQDQANDSADFS
ncbi:Imidazolonepropionase or related amidohydrolase [Geosmithia morbida]|uniref:Imidazolonepropionase or related amidohydrolase n=1 Tax=Geosmithia morbida TaxID=1094350 RepID=A0A9P4YVP8_9HYPO|nr:Imidazolonepropionase or related amidohydrolase [Geosmithia morbida]KAF4121874.1 Imidazolonepropionase or related amidohydrolase [Geosmithia morbida]